MKKHQHPGLSGQSNGLEEQPHQLLKAVLLVLITTLGIYLVVREMISGLELTYVEYILAGLWAVLLLAYFLSRKGYRVLSSVIAVMITFMAISAIALPGEGIRDPAVFSYAIIIIFATLLLGRIAAITTSLAGIAVIWIMVYLEQRGTIAYDLMPIGMVGRDLTVILVITGALATFYTSVITRYLKEIRHSRDRYQELSKSLREQNTQTLKINEELKAAKEKAEESDRLKTAFLTNLSHEIRTPMNGIIGFSELALSPGIPSEDRVEYNQIIASSCKQLLGVVNDIVDISKIESGIIEIHPRELSLNTLLKELFLHHRVEAKKRDLQLELVERSGERDDRIVTDRVKLRQILSNLIGNALKFTGRGKVSFGWTKKEDMVEFFVEDTGPGIDNSKLTRIFERFTQESPDISVKYGGTGLGLAIAKGYVEKLGGKISVRSEPGKGTRFSFNLPFETRPPDPSQQNKEDQVRPSTLQKVLVVEDIPVNDKLLREFLKEYEFDIISAQTGEEALDVFERTPDLGLIFMDIKLPGIDGFETTRRIRNRNPGIPIIAQTAYVFDSDRKKATDAGCDDMISKPITKSMVDRVIREYLSSGT